MKHNASYHYQVYNVMYMSMENKIKKFHHIIHAISSCRALSFNLSLALKPITPISNAYAIKVVIKLLL